MLVEWQKVKGLFTRAFASAADEAYAREQYFSVRIQAEQAQWRLYHSEANLRSYLMGLAATDGRLIGPVQRSADGQDQL